jgi:hypothetical protein
VYAGVDGKAKDPELLGLFVWMEQPGIHSKHMVVGCKTLQT